MRRGSEDEARKRICDSHTQCKNNQSVLGIIPGLHAVIPVVECFNERANKASEQSERDGNSRCARTHERSVLHQVASTKRTHSSRSILSLRISDPKLVITSYPRTARTGGRTKERNVSSLCDGINQLRRSVHQIRTATS
jgi:hypothetical protein